MKRRLPGAARPKLLDRVREAIWTRHYSRRTEKVYVHWIRRFIFFHAAASGVRQGRERVRLVTLSDRLAARYTELRSRITQFKTDIVRHTCGRETARLYFQHE